MAAEAEVGRDSAAIAAALDADDFAEDGREVFVAVVVAVVVETMVVAVIVAFLSMDKTSLRGEADVGRDEVVVTLACVVAEAGLLVLVTEDTFDGDIARGDAPVEGAGFRGAVMGLLVER